MGDGPARHRSAMRGAEPWRVMTHHNKIFQKKVPSPPVSKIEGFGNLEWSLPEDPVWERTSNSWGKPDWHQQMDFQASAWHCKYQYYYECKRVGKDLAKLDQSDRGRNKVS